MQTVHIIGAGPVGLLLTALLQPTEGVSVHLYEKRPAYTRTRMVRLASYLVADSIESYCADYIDGESVSAVFEPGELAEGLAFRQSIAPDLMALLRAWAVGFCPLNDIERTLSELIDARRSHPVLRTAGAVTVQEAMAMLAPDDIVIDCTGRSLLRDQLPMDLYRARNATSRRWHQAGGDHPFARSPVFLAGDSAMGSPYFQSISLGFECAMFLAGLLGRGDLPLRDVFDRYELYTYKQWLRVYMRSKMIKHNKDLFECIGDSLALLEKLHIY